VLETRTGLNEIFLIQTITVKVTRSSPDRGQTSPAEAEVEAEAEAIFWLTWTSLDKPVRLI
jgi:hypothetical protein